MILVIVIVAIVIILGFIIAAIYNSLVRLNQRSQEAWSDITVQLKRRYDLIPNLVNTVKGYATHEKGVFESVTAARSQALNATGVKETAEAENMMQSTLKSLFAVAEAYPDLKANQNFLQLQSELVDTEDKIQASRRFYNGVVRDFNTKRTTFPTNVLAGLFGFRTDKTFFEVDDAQAAVVAEPVNVSF